jgi:hypothetical protein
VRVSDVRRALSRRRSFAAVVRPNPWVLPPECGIRRDAPRPMDDRQTDYEEKYDRWTVFYDCFNADGRIILSGPPLRNLRDAVYNADWKVDHRKSGTRPALFDRGRTQESHLVVPRRASRLDITLKLARAELAVGSEFRRHFRGRRALLSISQNNKLEWIEDWLRFYVHEHGTDAVVLYDNGSTLYDEADLLDVLVGVVGVKAAVVVQWDFPWGPLAGPKGIFDSDFCQYGMLEHARQRFLRDAAGVINCDIDELVITSDRRPVYVHAARSVDGAVLYRGRMIENVVKDEVAGQERLRRFTDFLHYDPRVAPATPKWCIIPQRLPPSAQWRTHTINDVRLPYSSRVMHRHFKGINTNWRGYDRPEVVVDSSKHVWDDVLAEVLAERLGPA